MKFGGNKNDGNDNDTNDAILLCHKFDELCDFMRIHFNTFNID